MGLIMRTGLPLPFVPLGFAKILRSVRAKFPLLARPGPLFLRDLSASASIRTVRMIGKSTSAVTTQRSVFGFEPETRKEPSSSGRKIAPSRDLGWALPRMSQSCGAGTWEGNFFNHLLKRSGRVSRSNCSCFAISADRSFFHFSSFWRVFFALTSSSITSSLPFGADRPSFREFCKVITPLSFSSGTSGSARGKKWA